METLDSLIETIKLDKNPFSKSKSNEVLSDLFDVYSDNVGLSIDNFKNGQKRIRQNNRWISKKKAFDLLVNEYNIDNNDFSKSNLNINNSLKVEKNNDSTLDNYVILENSTVLKKQNKIKKGFFSNLKEKFFDYSSKALCFATSLVAAITFSGCAFNNYNPSFFDNNLFNKKEISSQIIQEKKLPDKVLNGTISSKIDLPFLIDNQLDNETNLKLNTKIKDNQNIVDSNEIIQENIEKITQNYIVQPGDGFYRIASNLGIDALDLATYNNMTFKTILHPGDVLKVPSDKMIQDNLAIQKEDINLEKEIKKDITYTVKQGDYLYKIANSFNISIDDILSVNSIEKNDIIYPGQKINIPINSFMEEHNLANFSYFQKNANNTQINIQNPKIIERIELEAKKIGINPSVFYALMNAESTYRIDVSGDKHIKGGSKSLFAFLKNTYNAYKKHNHVSFYDLTKPNLNSLNSNIDVASNYIQCIVDRYLSRGVDISKLDELRQVFLIGSVWRQGKLYNVNPKKENFGIPNNYYALDPRSKRLRREANLKQGIKDWNNVKLNSLYAIR
jgi:LysM repeat protein